MPNELWSVWMVQDLFSSHSPADRAAAANLGRILAQRCREAGIMNMIELSPETGEESGRVIHLVPTSIPLPMPTSKYINV